MGLVYQTTNTLVETDDVKYETKRKPRFREREREDFNVLLV